MSEALRFNGGGKVIKILRQDAGLSLSAFARLLGWDKGRLSKYENNQLSLSLSAIDDIAKALKMRPERIALLCLKERYPHLNRSETGELVTGLLEDLAS